MADKLKCQAFQNLHDPKVPHGGIVGDRITMHDFRMFKPDPSQPPPGGGEGCSDGTMADNLKCQAFQNLQGPKIPHGGIVGDRITMHDFRMFKPDPSQPPPGGGEGCSDGKKADKLKCQAFQNLQDPKVPHGGIVEVGFRSGAIQETNYPEYFYLWN